MFDSNQRFLNELHDADSSESDSDASPEPSDETSELLHRLRLEQRGDSGWRPIIDAIENPSATYSARLLRKMSDFEIRDGILYRLTQTETGPRSLLVVPASMRALVLNHQHDTRMAGHPGAKRTEKRIRQRYFWKSLKEDVRLYVDSCVICKTMKPPTQRKMGLLRSLESATAPLERVGIDKMGPIANSANGFAYIFVIVDYCSRYTFTEPVRDGTSATSLQVFKNFVLKFGLPKEVLSDNGPEFKGDFERAVKSHCRLSHSTPRHPQTNGMVERLNRTLSATLRTSISDAQRHTDWDVRLPSATYAYNTGVHEVTGFSPFYLMFGRHPIEAGAFGELQSDFSSDFHSPESSSGFLADSLDLKSAWSLSNERNVRSQLRDKARYDRHRKDASFTVGDLVVVDVSVMKVGRSHRFNPRRKGPYEVVRVFDNNTIELKGMERTSARINIDRCHRISTRPPYLEPDLPDSEPASGTQAANSSAGVGQTEPVADPAPRHRVPTSIRSRRTC